MPDFQKPKDPTPWKQPTASEEVIEATVKQRTIMWSLGLISLVTAVFGVLQIRSALLSPFKNFGKSNTNNAVVLSNDELQKLSELQSKDTDQDGLNDYEELYTYDTSPYLADSDSDEFSDKEELEQGENPNCPRGLTCDEARREGTDQTTAGATTEGETTTGDTTAAAPASTEVSVDTIREVLKNAGAPAEVVDSLDDNELIKLYNETVAETGTDITGTTAASTNTGAENSNGSGLFSELQTVEDPFAAFSDLDQETIDTLLNLPVEQIRQLLIQSGGDETLINSFDDATLQAIFTQAIQQLSTGDTAATEEIGSEDASSNTNTSTE
ncbi:MAG: hypothetical protein A3F54_04560 [Candidatus Kerfeldbacteria bacterium RIFCSPHIGHO2_12_FULL_48_17]|uniref:Uncharacterized protein n=1 Tax=Candidatus Kerfeldbacteria bacterium RIFCSPHIGHO2_12_FULL_48_17 TaxID=1798542 RepID=A0A1G2AYY8_9BACT|nr:MAG: hypothetical protein A3F54_04560 [Candidatus Kerfeldbacteria bacterium RIFCSPHIGHO2_12_FULL_48_17]